MRHFLFPPSLSGLSFTERNTLRDLGWKTGTLSDIADGDYTFILISGQLYDKSKRYYDPAREILGIKPFLKNTPKKFFSDKEHQICYIETKELARFFLSYPKAMQSYILYEYNAGVDALDHWKKFPRIWTVVSLQSAWQGIHFAFMTAAYLANTKKSKTVYLEMNSSGMSIYSFIEKEPRPPIMHIKEGLNPDPEMLLMERTIVYENVDIINVQHLSQWKMTREQWVIFYNVLAKKYDHIIIHCGDDKDTFLHEESDGLFILRKYRTQGYRGLHLNENNDLWPPAMEIFTTSLPGKKDAEIKYPLFYRKVINLQDIPFYSQLTEDYWSWFDKYPARLLNNKKVIVLGESSPSLLDSSVYLNQILKEGESLRDFLANNFVITEGASGIMTSLLAIARYKPEKIKKIFKRIKPVYPTRGFYSHKSFTKILSSSFKEISQDFLFLNFSTCSGSDIPLQWFTHGLIKEGLAASVFPPFCLEPAKTTPKARDFYSTNKLNWYEHIALAFRFGFESIDFYEFIVPESISTSVFAERFILSYNSIKSTINLTGKFSRYHYLFGTDFPGK